MVEGSTDLAIKRQLILRIMEKDQSALGDLAILCGTCVMPVIERKYRDLLDEAEIGAVLNQVVYNVWRSLGSFDPAKGTFEGWLYRIAEREAINCLRSDKSEGGTIVLEFDPPTAARRLDDTSVTDQPLVKELLVVIETLPRLQRAVIRADLAAGERADDHRLARRHGSTVNSIRATRTIARKKIRDSMLRRADDGKKDE